MTKIVFGLILVSLFLSLTVADNFVNADKNGDGTLDRGEFGAYLGVMKKQIGPYLASGDAHAQAHSGEEADPSEWELGGGTDDTKFMSSTFTSLMVIIATELGDKTFFIAAILAMRHGRMLVYSGAMLALALMHILSSMMGLALPSLLPRKYTHFASAVLFLYFGFRLLKDAHEMDGEGPSEELQEAEEELGIKKDDDSGNSNNDDDRNDDIEFGKESRSPSRGSGGGNSLFAGDAFKVFSQSFTLTFLAEWGDRSQIATIGLAASKNVMGVILGGVVGHALCTGLAVVGGRMLATRISAKTVAYVGGFLFLAFSFHAFVFEE